MTRPATKRGKPFHWFQGESVSQLYEQLAAAGPTTARIEVYQEGKKMTLRVVPEVSTSSHTNNHINDSHLCPPDCPG